MLKNRKKKLGIWEDAVLAVAVLAAVAVPLFLVSCGDTVTNVNVATNTNQTQSGATNTPRPTPETGAAGTSDVDSMAIFLYGYSCNAGITAPANTSWLLPMNCRAAITATPKTAANVDAKNHGNNLTWSASTDVAKLEAQAIEPIFNRNITPIKPGHITITATLVDPAGLTHVAVRELDVVP